MAEDSAPATGTTEELPDDPSTGQQVDQTPDHGDEALRDAGKKAIEQERVARRDAQKQLRATQTRLKELEDRDKTDQQKLEERASGAETRVSALESENTDLKAQLARVKIGVQKGLPVELIDRLRGDDEQSIAKDADALAKQFARARPPGGFDNGVRDSAPADGDFNRLIRQAAGRA
jgi:hypothetical protein